MKQFYLIILTSLLIQFSNAQGWNWQNPLPQGNSLYSVFYTSATTGYAVGHYGTIIKTVDGGITWTLMESGTTSTLLSVYFPDANDGYIAGANGTLLKTIDAGNDWVTLTSVTIDTLCSVFFPDNNTGFAVGRYGNILKTTDGGTNWESYYYPTDCELNSVFFTDASNGYIAGLFGAIFKTTNGGGFPSGISEKSQTTSIKVYPNPAKDKCKVQCAKCNIKNIEIFNLTGEKVYNAEFPAGGSDVVEVDLDVPAGIYFVRVTSDKSVEVGKIVKE